MEKLKNDDFRQKATLRHETVAMRSLHSTCPHFVIKIQTKIPHRKKCLNPNKIKGLNMFSTFSTAPNIYYNY